MGEEVYWWCLLRAVLKTHPNPPPPPPPPEKNTTTIQNQDLQTHPQKNLKPVLTEYSLGHDRVLRLQGLTASILVLGVDAEEVLRVLGESGWSQDCDISVCASAVHPATVAIFTPLNHVTSEWRAPVGCRWQPLDGGRVACDLQCLDGGLGPGWRPCKWMAMSSVLKFIWGTAWHHLRHSLTPSWQNVSGVALVTVKVRERPTDRQTDEQRERDQEADGQMD